MFTVSVPDAVTGATTEHCYAGTIKFITPRGEKKGYYPERGREGD